MNELDFNIERLILKIGNTINGIRDDDLGKHELTSTQSEAILFYRKHEGESIKDLARHLKISHQAAQKLVDKLASKDILRKEISEDDKRYCKVYLTEPGNRLCSTLMRKGALTGKSILGGFSETEKEELFEFLQRIGDTVSR